MLHNFGLYMCCHIGPAWRLLGLPPAITICVACPGVTSPCHVLPFSQVARLGRAVPTLQKEKHRETLFSCFHVLYVKFDHCIYTHSWYNFSCILLYLYFLCWHNIMDFSGFFSNAIRAGDLFFELIRGWIGSVWLCMTVWIRYVSSQSWWITCGTKWHASKSLQQRHLVFVLDWYWFIRSAFKMMANCSPC